MKSTSLFGLALAAITFCIYGCSSEAQTTGTSQSTADKEEVLTEDSTAFYELAYNHVLLRSLYYGIQAVDFDEDPSRYYGVHSAPDSSKGYCTSAYADICGMYNKISDPATRYYDPNTAPDILEQLSANPETDKNSKTATVSKFIQDSILVVSISKFALTSTSFDGTYGEYKSILENYKNSSSIKSVVVDLRDNPGGINEQCAKIAAEFLNVGDTLYQEITAQPDSSEEDDRIFIGQKFKTTPYTVDSTSDGLSRNRYYVFLANGNTSSCAELLLSAVSSYRKFPIVGQTTYGNGMGQLIQPTLAGGLSIITAYKITDKNGESFNESGIAPDYEISDPDLQLEKAIELARDGVAQRTVGYGTRSSESLKKVNAYRKNGLVPGIGLYKLISK